MDVAGHIIHIDFGFMLSNSPGGVNFEAAPFKLTRELLEIMDSNSEGHASEIFDYFKVGCTALYILPCQIAPLDYGASQALLQTWHVMPRSAAMAASLRVRTWAETMG